MSTNSYNENQQSSLTEQLATRLVQGSSQPAKTATPTHKNNKPIKACIAVAGGGSNAASSILSIPGASSVLLESIVTYDRKSFAEFVTQNIVNCGSDDEDWLIDLETMSAATSSSDGNNNREGQGDISHNVSTFHFCSTQASILLSKSALHRSLQLTTPNFTNHCLYCIGVGCTSSLVGKISTPSSNEGEETDNEYVEDDVNEVRRAKRKSRAYIACSTMKDGTWVWEIELDNSDGSSNRNGRRTRSEEEAVISNLILLAMTKYQEKGQTYYNLFDSLIEEEDDFGDLVMQILDRDGDDLTIKRIGTSPTIDGRVDIDDGDGGRTSAANGASQIIDGEANVVAVLPIHTHSNEGPPRMEALFADNSIPFPRDVLIVPGSFNPPHQGHVGLASAAVSALRRLRQQNEEATNQNNDASAINTRPYSRYSSLASNSSSSSSSSSAILKRMWSTVDQYVDEQYEPTVFFEMSVTNADKPPLDPLEVERRVNLFTTLPPADMPKDWAVILTNAPLFSQKASILDNLIAGDCFDTDNNQSSNIRKMSFVLGTDTMVRIINPKYYDNSREKMLAALVDMKEKGVHFIVGGRLEQGTGENRYVLICMFLLFITLLYQYCSSHLNLL